MITWRSLKPTERGIDCARQGLCAGFCRSLPAPGMHTRRARPTPTSARSVPERKNIWKARIQAIFDANFGVYGAHTPASHPGLAWDFRRSNLRPALRRGHPGPLDPSFASHQTLRGKHRPGARQISRDVLCGLHGVEAGEEVANISGRNGIVGRWLGLQLHTIQARGVLIDHTVHAAIF